MLEEMIMKKQSNTGQKGSTANRGFASMDEDKQREIASKGGKAAHEKGTAHEFTPEEAREAGRKGGSQASHGKSSSRESGQNRGKSGGQSSQKDSSRESGQR
jgi:general stress protein YciG